MKPSCIVEIVEYGKRLDLLLVCCSFSQELSSKVEMILSYLEKQSGFEGKTNVRHRDELLQ